MFYLYRTLKMAVHALARNVLRSALTTLGIVIGVAAVIAMVAFGQGTNTAVKKTIPSMGANKLLVRELFGEEPAVGQVVRVNNQPMRVIGVLALKGANMMGMDQDDVLLAPWRTIKSKVAGTSATTANQSAAAAAAPTQQVFTSSL